MLADLGSAELAKPEQPEQWKHKPSDQSVLFSTAQYRPPDMLLGSQRFGPDIDLWSLGCVAAELFLRQPLFQLEGKSSKNSAFSMRTSRSLGRLRRNRSSSG